MALTSHHHFTTTTTGLHRGTPAMRLFEKAKIYGIWNPSEIDFAQDKLDWQQLTEAERTVLLHLTSIFASGEEAVTLDLLPLIMTVAQEGYIEEEMFLTSFLWEEAKHTDFFDRFLREVAGVTMDDLSRFHGPSYRKLFYDLLPERLNTLMTDRSPAAQVRASVTYNMIVEGTLAETGYHAYHEMLRARSLMPGTLKGIERLKQDESRHIAYGIYLISRLVAGESDVYAVAEATMNEGLMLATGVVNEIFDAYDAIPFGLQQDTFLGYAMMQFQKRYARIAAANGATLAEVQRITQRAIAEEDA